MDVVVRLLPTLVDQEQLADRVAIVIDAFRATTTITAALSNGARSVRPMNSVGEALAARETSPQSLIGGERGGKKVDGFDFGNSPSDYNRSNVSGRDITFSTSHGTKAILAARRARATLLGCFNNLSAAAKAAADMKRSICILCSGTDDDISIEDAFCAAFFLRKLRDEYAFALRGDTATMLDVMLGAVGNHWRNFLINGQGARNIAAVGPAADLDFALAMDTSDAVPMFDATTGTIRLLAAG